MSREAEDAIEDYVIDWLFKLVRKADTENAHKLSAFMVISLSKLAEWYKQKKRPVIFESWTDKTRDSVFTAPAFVDILEYTGCPHKEVVAKILASDEPLKQKLTVAELSQWKKKQKEEVATYLRELYEF